MLTAFFWLFNCQTPVNRKKEVRTRDGLKQYFGAEKSGMKSYKNNRAKYKKDVSSVFDNVPKFRKYKHQFLLVLSKTEVTTPRTALYLSWRKHVS